MEIKVRKPVCNSNGEQILQHIEKEFIQCNEESIMSIDGSTTCTGIAILRKRDYAILYTIACIRDKANESPVRFKVRLKNVVKEILEHNRTIKDIYYEEPFVGFASAAPNLFMLKAFIEELIIESEPEFNYLKHYEINNKRWKKIFLYPEKLAGSTEAEKEQVRKKLVGFIPVFKDITQDEIDAASMGFACLTETGNGASMKDLESKKKVHAFKYNIEFIAADENDEALEYLSDISSKIPDKVLNNGIVIREIKSKNNFDKAIYETMESDDKLVIIKFKSDTHSDIIVKHRIGALSLQGDYLYAFVWRKSRKYS